MQVAALPVRGCERKAAGELLHLDSKKLARFAQSAAIKRTDKAGQPPPDGFRR